MAFRKLALIFALLASASATTTVTGKLVDVSTTPLTSGTFVRFALKGTYGYQPRVNGTALIGPQTSGPACTSWCKDFIPDTNGNISGTVYSTRDATGNNNGEIETDPGDFTSTWYGVQLFVNGRGGPEIAAAAKIGATLNVTNFTPITTTPVVTAPTGDNVYLRLDGGNGPATGAIQFNAITGINKVVYCDSQPGATADAKIQACYNAVNAQGGGIADARGFSGAQTWSSTVTCYSNTKLLLPQWSAATFNVSSSVNSTYAIYCTNVNNVVINGGFFQLSGGNANNTGLGAIGVAGTSSHIEVSDVQVSGDSTLPGNTNFTITSLSLTSNVLTVNYSGTPSPALVVGQMVSIIGVTTDPTINIELPLASVGSGTFTMAYTHANVGTINNQGTWRTEPKFQMSSIQRTSNVITVTCTNAATCNGLTVGKNVIIECGTNCGSIDTTMPGYYVVATVPGNGTFTVASTGSNSGPFANTGVFATENQQYGIILSGTITDGKILRDYLQNLTWAIGCGTSGLDNINGCTIDGNHLFNIVGYATGAGYGIIGQTNTFGGYRIVNNFMQCVQRHDVYTGAGQGHVIANNYSSRHGCDAPSGGDAFAVGRQSDTTITANNFSFSYGNAINIFSGANSGSNGQVPTKNVTIAANTFNNTYGFNYAISGSNGQIHDIAVGAENNTVDVPHDIDIVGNVSRRTNVGTLSSMVSITYGIGINVVDNDCSYDSFTSTDAACFEVVDPSDSGGTATYANNLNFSNNLMRISGSSGDTAVYLSSNVSPSTIKMSFQNNTLVAGSNSGLFWSGTQTDPNATFFNSPLGNTVIGKIAVQSSGTISINSSTQNGSLYSLANASTGLLPTITSQGAGIVGDSNTTLGSGTGKTYGVIGLARGSSDASGDRAFGGWFKATAGNNTTTEIGLHAETNDTGSGPTIAEFVAGGSQRVKIDGVGDLTQNGPSVSAGTLSISGTGACATITTTSGGAWSGQGTCTGTTGATTLVITFSNGGAFTAPHGSSCFGSDITAGVAAAQSAASTTTCTLKWTSLTQNDVVTFTVNAF